MLSLFLQAFWQYILAGVGEMANKSAAEKNLVIACFMLYTFFYNARHRLPIYCEDYLLSSC